MKRLGLILSFVVVLAACRERSAPLTPDTSPRRGEGNRIGEKLAELPSGSGKDLADARCLPCHSAEIILQQRLTEKQWNAVLDKMVRWGTELDANQRAQLLPYLVQNFGPENTDFVPHAGAPPAAQ